MKKVARSFLVVVSAIQLLFALAFFLQWPFATNLWPFAGTTPLTFIFVSSIFAAAGASTLWAVLSENDGALAGIGLDYLTILVPVSIFLLRLGASGGNALMIVDGILCALGALFGLGLFLSTVGLELDRMPPMPGPVRWSFVIFIVALLIVAGRLIFQVPGTIPWMITPELSVVMGWMFLGAAAYFGYGLLRPSWANSAGQLVGFLAYDVVLIVPFLRRLPTVSAEHRTGMIIYTAVVIYSGLLAIYYLFLHRPTRLRLRQEPGAREALSESG